MAQTKPTSIFYQVQQIIAGQLNSDEMLSAAGVVFIPENAKDIDYEVGNALGKQGIVGVVMTPRADYIGITAPGELAYDLRDITVQIVENAPVNRGLSASVTALDASQRVQELLASPRFTTFGIMCPKSIEQGEDSGLIVCQAKFDCSLHTVYEPVPPAPEPTVYGVTTQQALGFTVGEDGVITNNLPGGDLVVPGTTLGSSLQFALAYKQTIDSVTFTELSSLSNYSYMDHFLYRSSVKSISFPALKTYSSQTCTYMCDACRRLSSVSFPELETISSGDMSTAFRETPSLQIVEFPKLKSISSGSAAFSWAFNNTGLETLEFPELVSLNSHQCFLRSSVKKMYFPKLSSLQNSFEIFKNNLNLQEVHFGAANREAIEAAPGYANRFSAPSTCQILFDL